MRISLKSVREGHLALGFLSFSIAILPLVYVKDILDPCLAPRFSFLGLLVFSLAFFAFFKKKWQVAPWSGIFILFLSLEGLSLFYAHNPNEAIRPLIGDLLLFFFLIVMVPLLVKRFAKNWLAKALIICTIILSAFAFIQLVEFQAWQNSEMLYQVSSFMGHRNLLASALLLAWPWLVFISWKGKGIWRFLGLISLLASIVLIVVLESRTVWIASLVFALVFTMSGLASRAFRKVKMKYWLAGFVSLLIGFLLVFIVVKIKEEGSIKKAQELKTSVSISSTEEKNFTVSERLLLWKATLNMVWDNGWGGVGAGNWKIQFPAYGSDIWRARQGLVQFQRPHNDFLWVLSELGILGFLSYLALFVFVLASALLSIGNSSISMEDRQFIKLLLAGLIAYLVIALFSFPRERVFHQILLYLGIASILSFRKKAELSLKASLVMKTLAAIIGLLGLTFGLNWWQGEKLTVKINQARAEGNWQKLLTYTSALEGNRFYQIDPVSIPICFYSGLAHLNLQNYGQSKADFEMAYKLHPNNIHVINNLANINLLVGDLDRAINFYQQALDVSPKYLDGALNLMAAYYNGGRITEAFEFLVEYEPIFAVDRPDHPSLGLYRNAIVMAQFKLLCPSFDKALRELCAGLTEQAIMDCYEAARKEEISFEETLLRRLKE